MESGNQSMKTEPGLDLVISLDKHEIYKLKPIKIEQGINLSFEEKLLSLEKEIDVLKEQKFWDNQVINKLSNDLLESQYREKKLRESHAEAECCLKELRVRVSNLEDEKKAAYLTMEALKREKSEADVMALKADEMLKESEQRSSEKLLRLEKVIDLLQRRGFLDHQVLNTLKAERSEFMVREMDLRERNVKAERNSEELQVIVSNLEREKREASLIIEELRREKSEANETVKESRQRSLKASEAVGVSIRRLENVVPMAEGFFKLLKMNVGDLVEMKNMLVGEEDVTNKLGMTGPNDIISNRGLKRKRSGFFGAEIVRAFQEDDELCIQAMHELCRQVSNSECSNISFYHFEQLWRYDSEAKRPIAEIKQRFPHIVGLCRQLAMEYSSYLVALPGTRSWGQDEDEGCSLSVSLVCRRCYMVTDSHDAGACETVNAHMFDAP